MTEQTPTTTCGYDSDMWHVHQYEIPQTPGYHIEIEERLHEGAIVPVAAWRVREPVEPWLPGTDRAPKGEFASLRAAFSALAPGRGIPPVECARGAR